MSFASGARLGENANGSLRLIQLLQRLGPNRFAARQIGWRAGWQFARDGAKSRPQSFFEHGMIEGHPQQVVNREFLADRQSQEMRHMLGRRYRHFPPRTQPSS